MSLQKSIPTKGRKRGDPLQGSPRRVTGKPSEDSSNLPGEVYFKMHHPDFNHKGPMISPALSRQWPHLLASWILKSTRSRRGGLDERTSRPLTMWQKVPLKTSIFPGWCIPPKCLRSWAEGNPFPQHSPQACRTDLLSTVWKRGPE